jgi:hypothetical protein
MLAAVRWLALLLSLASLSALADEVDLTKSPQSGSHGPPTWVLRAEGGNAFAPYGYAGAAVSWYSSGFELEGGMGAGFPGLQLGLAARSLFLGGEDGQFLLAEFAIAGNTRVNRGNDQQTVTSAQSSVWTNLGIGAELRQDFYSLSVVTSIVFTTQSLTPHFAIHGGIGFGF